MSGDVERVSACLKGWDEVGQLSEADDFLQLSGSLLYALRAASCLTTAGSCERLGVSSARESLTALATALGDVAPGTRWSRRVYDRSLDTQKEA